MRILQISSARTYGGGERHLVDLCRGMARRGHDVYVALRPTNDWEHRLDFLPPERILHVSIRNSFGVLSAMRIADFIRENEIQIVHAHVARDYIPTSIACMAAKDAKFVLTRHVLFPLKPFNRFALKNLSKAIGVSDAVGSGLKKIFAASKVEVIENGIDLEGFDLPDVSRLRKEFRDLHDVPEEAPLIGTLGELKELKGQRDFVLAAHEIAKKISESRFVIAGRDNSFDKSFRRELKRLVKVLDLEDRFLWLDWVDDTAAFYAALDVFVSPSHSESFGLAILEAMARGRPVVATATEGARALIGTSGNLVPVRDPVRLAEKICDVLADADLLRESGLELQKVAAEKFSLARMLDQTEKLYASLCR